MHIFLIHSHTNCIYRVFLTCKWACSLVFFKLFYFCIQNFVIDRNSLQEGSRTRIKTLQLLILPMQHLICETSIKRGKHQKQSHVRSCSGQISTLCALILLLSFSMHMHSNHLITPDNSFNKHLLLMTKRKERHAGSKLFCDD